MDVTFRHILPQSMDVTFRHIWMLILWLHRLMQNPIPEIINSNSSYVCVTPVITIIKAATKHRRCLIPIATVTPVVTTVEATPTPEVLNSNRITFVFTTIGKLRNGESVE
jgi:hypothetical protein